MTGANHAGYASLATSSWSRTNVPGAPVASSQRRAKSCVGVLAMVSMALTRDAE